MNSSCGSKRHCAVYQLDSSKIGMCANKGIGCYKNSSIFRTVSENNKIKVGDFVLIKNRGFISVSDFELIGLFKPSNYIVVREL